MVHECAEFVGATKSRETVAEKIGYVKRMYDHAVRKGWVPSNIFLSVKLDKNVGRQRESYKPFSDGELQRLYGQVMPDLLRELLSVLVTTGMRLDEAALLNWEDIKADAAHGVTYFDPTAANVKNRGSQRRVTVHPKLDWVMTGRTGQMFPQFTQDRDGKAQASALKALMPLIRKATDNRKKVAHSLRGNFKDMHQRCRSF